MANRTDAPARSSYRASPSAGSIVAAIVALGVWRRQRDEFFAAEDAAPRPVAWLARTVTDFALQDWLVLSYLSVLLVEVLVGSGPRRPMAIACLLADFATVATVILATRGGLVPSRFASGLLYRLALIGAPLGSFFQFQLILPTGAGRTLDASIYAFDVRVFGVEPSVAWDRFVTPAVTEWFSFFYFSYFFLLALHVVPMMLFERRMRVMREFTWGLLSVFCVGQALYLVVPGYGPYHALSFHNELSGSFWWPLVSSTVASVEGSSRLDIFPSLHTAVPTFLALFSLRNRNLLPFRYTWPVLAFFASQIVIATMFLRWHYLIDICAGLTLAASAAYWSRWVAVREELERGRFGSSTVFEPLFGAANES